MSARGLTLLVVALALASLLLATQRQASAPAAGGAASALAPGRPHSEASPAVVDPESIRDLFHFTAPRVRSSEAPTRAALEGAAATDAVPTVEPQLRLVGLVRQSGRLRAAFAVSGDVVLAGPGEAAGELTVLEVGEEGVRVRWRDGREETLVLP